MTNPRLSTPDSHTGGTPNPQPRATRRPHIAPRVLEYCAPQTRTERRNSSRAALTSRVPLVRRAHCTACPILRDRVPYTISHNLSPPDSSRIHSNGPGAQPPRRARGGSPHWSTILNDIIVTGGNGQEWVEYRAGCG